MMGIAQERSSSWSSFLTHQVDFDLMWDWKSLLKSSRMQRYPGWDSIRHLVLLQPLCCWGLGCPLWSLLRRLKISPWIEVLTAESILSWWLSHLSSQQVPHSWEDKVLIVDDFLANGQALPKAWFKSSKNSVASKAVGIVIEIFCQMVGT